MSAENKSFYHFMVAAKIIFGPKPQEGEPESVAFEQVQGVEMNAIVLNDSETFPVKMISRAKQAAHLQFLRRIGNEAPIMVHDVVILNLIPLGLMSKEEFNLPAEQVGDETAGSSEGADTTNVFDK